MDSITKFETTLNESGPLNQKLLKSGQLARNLQRTKNIFN